MNQQIAAGIRLQRSPAALFSETASGVVIMDIGNGRYYSLNETGSAIWQALSTPITEAEIVNWLTARFAVVPDTCQQKVAQFLEQLLTRGVIETAAGTSSNA